MPMKDGLKRIKAKLERHKVFYAFLTVLFMAVWVFCSLMVAELVVGYVMLFILGRETLLSTVPSAIYSIISYLLALVLIAVLPAALLKRWHTSRHQLGIEELPTWTDIGLGVIGFIVSLLFAAALMWIFERFPWFNINEAQSLGFSPYLADWEKIIAFIILVCVAPIIEETIFRGWLYGKMRERLHGIIPDWANIGFSIFAVSLLFGIVHMQWNVGVNVFALSVVLCTLREITGTIHAGIIAHMIKNALAFYVIYKLGV